MKRLIEQYLFDPEMNAGKMLFLTGPRQVGKTTFAQNWLAERGFSELYFNWDDPAVMGEYRRNPLYFKNMIDARFEEQPLSVVFDEIHKHKNWRNILKGVYDTNKGKMTLLVTGSARPGWLRKSGDSLAGRYFSYQMLPLGLPEASRDFSHVLMDHAPLGSAEQLVAAARKAPLEGARDSLDDLLSFGGFPEPFLRKSPRFHNRWTREYTSLITREDIRDISGIADVKGMEQLVEMLPSKIGAALSINSIREDTGYHHATITRWIDMLKTVYLVFTLRPWHKRISRAILKENKLYFFDWSQAPDAGKRFENLLAVSLVKLAARLTETGQGVFEVMYIRNKEKMEVDFVLVKDNNPLALFEARESDTRIGKAAHYFSKQLDLPFFQVVNNAPESELFPGNRAVIDGSSFLMLSG